MKMVLAAAGATVAVTFGLVFAWVVLQERRSRHLAAALDWHERQERDAILARKFGEG